MAEMWRLFIANELPPSIVADLASLQVELKRQTPPHTVRWVEPKGIHLTLKFLGDVPIVQRDALERALLQAVQGHHPFDLEVGAIGCFPNTRRPRVVWVGIREQSSALRALQASVEAHIAPFGFPTENRPFSPHLTLGRVRPEARRADIEQFGNLIASTTLRANGRWTVTGVSLIRSELKPTGAIYTTLTYAPLAPPDSPSA